MKSLPNITAYNTTAHSLRLHLSPTDQYLLNGRLRNISVFYQPLSIRTQYNGPILSRELEKETLGNVDVELFERWDMNTNHEEFFRNTSWLVEMHGLAAYWWYAFNVAYETKHSLSNVTDTYIIRTKEDGKCLLLVSFTLSYRNASFIMIKITINKDDKEVFILKIQYNF